MLRSAANLAVEGPTPGLVPNQTGDTMSNWRPLLEQIRQTQTEILRLAPHRDVYLVPNPGASDIAIEAAEERIGQRLPPSYRDFLRFCDGWPRFFEGASLLGTANLGKRLYEDFARAIFDAAETPVPDLGPPSRKTPRVIVPFGADVQATTLFAFNPGVSYGDEWEVIAWINEIGVRRESFPDFLELVLELCEAELASLKEAELTGHSPGEMLKSA